MNGAVPPSRPDLPGNLVSPAGGVCRLRGEDAWGAGAFGAPRGERLHRGVDIEVRPGRPVFAPFPGRVVRRADPYGDDDRFAGLLLAGDGAWAGVEAKLFYLRGEPGRTVKAGEAIGRAQDIGARYPGITPHIHLEICRDGRVVDPTPWLPRP